ncbi:MAG: phosphoenolpyruvate synthase [Gammaproteobacteria bacterium]|nr:phosphoenolpyruvate synthase [Gammaproteobacteria bacterium]
MSGEQQFIRDADDDTTLNEVGGKAWALIQLYRAGFNVPGFFVITPAAFHASLSARQRTVLAAGDDAETLADIVTRFQANPEVIARVEAAVNDLSEATPWLAVRSSAVDEDGSRHSFAGQLDSFLFVSPAQIVDRMCAVWRSGFSARLLEYRRQKGLTMTPQPPAVLVQRMVNADAAGVAFSADPIGGHRQRCVISSCFGIADALVAGAAAADVHHVDRTGAIVQRQIAHKPSMQQLSPQGGVVTVALAGDKSDSAAIGDTQIVAVAELARRAARHFNRPQDIEWAVAGDALWLLQSRPITTLNNVADADGETIIWDNSNIVESYSGVTTPLTFSFIRQAYEAVYLELVRLLGVPGRSISAQRHLFANMLGLIQGRVYYNLLNWYRVLAMLPGFSLNRGFMDQMMGVGEALPPAFVADVKGAGRGNRIIDLFRLGATVTGMLINHFRIDQNIAAFYRRLDTSLAPPGVAIEEMGADELVHYYHQLEQALLRRWDAPLVNDLFAMIFYGLLRKLVTRWCDDSDGALQNNLLTGEGGMISAEPAQRVRQMALTVCGDEAFVHLLVNGELAELRREMDRHPEFTRQLNEYLDRFADRCLEELKLESLTLRDDPLLLLRSVGMLAARGEQLAASPRERELAQRRAAEQRVASALRLHPLRRVVFAWVLRHARARVRDRENLRFERTRVFGRVRRIFKELGKRLYAQDRLQQPRDIFYLELHEVIGLIAGTATTTVLDELVALRRREFADHRRAEPPPGRFTTCGGVHLGNSFTASAQRPPLPPGELQGIGCCPGHVTGVARVIRDPRNAQLLPGEILVAQHTDPGWILLFAAAAGIVVERGSLLSHSAIVAREMNIPAVVAVDDVTRIIHSGDLIGIDGGSGRIDILKRQATDHDDR